MKSSGEIFYERFLARRPGFAAVLTRNLRDAGRRQLFCDCFVHCSVEIAALPPFFKTLARIFQKVLKTLTRPSTLMGYFNEKPLNPLWKSALSAYDRRGSRGICAAASGQLSVARAPMTPRPAVAHYGPRRRRPASLLCRRDAH